MIQQGYAVPWKSDAEVMPWYAIYLAASGQFIQQQGPVLQKFLEVYLLASRQVNAANGVWTPDLLSLAADKSGTPADNIKALGSLQYYDANGRIPAGGLDNPQNIFAAEGLVKQKVDTNTLSTSGPLDAALQKVGVAAQ
ncbi:MAG: hypothetical protein JOZ39_03365 [Chloroflexi bacterium]|nr:hypothetical protein [Chloroflexota bacterium]